MEGAQLVSIYISGSFPPTLYRAFKKEGDRRDFLERGNFVMRPLSYYREIEDSSRRDEDEGEGRVRVVRPRPVVSDDRKSVTHEIGEVFFGTASVNPVYILCFFGPEVDLNYLLAKGFRYGVRIDQPQTLVSEIGRYLDRQPYLPHTMWLHCIQVRYDKGEVVKELPEPGSEARLLMSCGQKANRFRGDCEYRIVLRLPVPSDAPRDIRIDLGRRLEYVATVPLPADSDNASRQSEASPDC